MHVSISLVVDGAEAPSELCRANPASTMNVVGMICQQFSLCFVPRANLPWLAVVCVKVLPAYSAKVLVKNPRGL